MTAGELRSAAQLSEANMRQLGTPGAAADGSSGSAGGGGLPTLPQEVVAKLLEALWTPMYSVREVGSTLMATDVRAALPLVVLSPLVGCLRHPALPASALLQNALIVGRKLLKR